MGISSHTRFNFHSRDSLQQQTVPLYSIRGCDQLLDERHRILDAGISTPSSLQLKPLSFVYHHFQLSVLAHYHRRLILLHLTFPTQQYVNVFTLSRSRQMVNPIILGILLSSWLDFHLSTSSSSSPSQEVCVGL